MRVEVLRLHTRQPSVWLHIIIQHLPIQNNHLRWIDDHQSVWISISTFDSPLPMLTHLNTLSQYWVRLGCSTNKTVITVIQAHRLNFSELLINTTRKIEMQMLRNIIGISPSHITFKYETLLNTSVAFVVIKKQSNDKNTPEELPACLTDENASYK